MVILYRHIYIDGKIINTMDLEILRKVGLSNGEIKVYKALLEIGVASVNSIHEKIGIDRRNIYDILNKLVERGLISYIEENGKRTFKLANPDKILSYMDEKKSDLEKTRKEIANVIPSIQEVFKSEKETLFAEIFKGKEGIKAVWDDMLDYKSIYWIGSGFYIPDKFPAFWNDWNKRRIKKKINSHHLFRSEKRKHPGIKSLGKLTKWKFLPIEFSGAPTVTAIYGNKVTNFLFGERLFAFVMESKELADNYKVYHKYLWKNMAKK